MSFRRELAAFDVKIAEVQARMKALKDNWVNLKTADAIEAFGKLEDEIRELRRQRHQLYPRERAKAYFDIN